MVTCDFVCCGLLSILEIFVLRISASLLKKAERLLTCKTVEVGKENVVCAESFYLFLVTSVYRFMLVLQKVDRTSDFSPKRA